MALTLASATETSNNNNHHIMKRAPQGQPGGAGSPLQIFKKKAKKGAKLTGLALALASSGGDSEGSGLPPHISPNIGMSTEMFQSMPITESFAGPLSVLGGLLIIISFVMAASYFSAVNANKRSGYDYTGPYYIQKRSSFDINPEPIMSYINSSVQLNATYAIRNC